VVALADLIGKEPVPELGVVAVSVEDRVRAVGLVELAGGHGLVEPPVVGRASKAEYPTRHRDGDPVAGEPAHERVDHPSSWEAGLTQIGSRSSQHLVLLLEEPDPALRLPQLGHLAAR